MLIFTNDDIKKTQDVHNIVYSPNYSKIYFKSNEYLNELFKNIDLRDKRVLTVVGSGDQSFLCYDEGCESVDLFDINKLAIYYYYLRIWVIDYMNDFYPDLDSYNYLSNLLKKVEPKTEDERNAYLYWCQYAKTSFIKTGSLFYRNNGMIELKISDLNRIKDKLKERNFNVYNVDISKPWNHDKKYDIIFSSNISDYVPKEEESFKIYRDNLYDLLEDDGVVVCSRLGNGCSRLERDKFKEKFIKREFPKIWGYEGKLESIGYSYRKR